MNEEDLHFKELIEDNMGWKYFDRIVESYLSDKKDVSIKVINETVTLTKEQFEYMNHRCNMLRALEQARVEDWQGYDVALEYLKEGV